MILSKRLNTNFFTAYFIIIIIYMIDCNNLIFNLIKNKFLRIGSFQSERFVQRSEAEFPVHNLHRRDRCNWT